MYIGLRIKSGGWLNGISIGKSWRVEFYANLEDFIHNPESVCEIFYTWRIIQHKKSHQIELRLANRSNEFCTLLDL